MNDRLGGLLACGPLVIAGLLIGEPAAFAQAVATPAPAATAPERRFSAPVQPSEPIFLHLFEDTFRDLRRLPSRETAQWLSIGAAAAMFGHSVDRPLSASMSSSPLLDEPFEAGETLGGARVQLGMALTTYTLGRVTGSSKVAKVGADLLRAQMIAQTITFGVKMSARRTRPDGTRFSFPSGHTSVTFASATVLQRDLGWKAGIPAFAVASYVAASRIQEKRHYLSDVAFGAAIGIIAGKTVTVGSGRHEFAVTPVAAPGGGGLAFTWTGAR